MKKIGSTLFLALLALLMLYPLLWLFGASFKTNAQIFSSVWFWPEQFSFQPYLDGWKTASPYTMGHYFLNTAGIVLPRILFTLVSSTLTAYGFSRFDFPGKRGLFALLIAGMLLPEVITRIPNYLLWRTLGALDSYLPLTLPSLFATEGIFVFLLMQFFAALPKELEDAARIDGCNSMQTLWYVLVPCIRPALLSVAMFTFLWTMNEFVQPLIYISSVERYPLSLALRMSMDNTGQGYAWNKIIAMSLLGLLPSIAVFLLAQKRLTAGIATSGIAE